MVRTLTLALILAACGSASATQTTAPPASEADCPAELRASPYNLEPTPLELRLHAAFSQCEGDARLFEVHLDGEHVGTISVPCIDIVDIIRAPPASYLFRSEPLAPGDHALLIVDVAGDRRLEQDIGLPAFAISSDGGNVFRGSHVSVWIGDVGDPELEIRIDQPTAFPTMGS